MKKKYFIDVICFLVSVIFIYAGVSKLLDNNNFVLQLYKSPLLPEFVIIPISIFFPIIEIITGVFIFFKSYRRLALYTSLVLYTLFTTYLIILNTFFIDIPCSCGGILGKMSYEIHIIFNLFFLIIIIIALNGYEKSR